jgi:integrase
MAAWVEKRANAITVRWKFRGRYGRRKAPDLKTARRLIREIETCHALGEHWIPLDQSSPIDPCLTELFKDRIEQGRRTRKPNTLEGWRVSFVLFVDFLRLSKPRGRLAFSSLNPRNLYSFHAWLIDTRGNGESTAALRLSAIRTTWSWASNNIDWIDHAPRYLEVEVPQAPPPRAKRSPTWTEVDEMITTLDQKRVSCGSVPRIKQKAESSYRAAVIMRYTGLRMSQASALEWDDLNFEDRTLEIRGALGKSRHERRGRVIPVSGHLCDEMAGWGLRDGLIVGAEPLSRITLSHNIRLAWKASEVDPCKWAGQTAHSLRRAFTSELVRGGADRFAVEILLGRSTGVGGDVYTDPRFVWDRLDHAVSLVTRIGDSNQIKLSDRKAAEGRD